MLPCWDSYITLDSSTPSNSGLYANELPGVTLDLLDSLTTSDQEDYLAAWTVLYKRSVNSFVKDAESKLKDRFHMTTKVTRETSKTNFTENTGAGQAGVQYEYYRSKYARNFCISISVNSLVAYQSPPVIFTFTDAATGRVLYTKTASLTTGFNTIPINQDLGADQIQITYNKATARFYQSINRYYDSTNYLSYDKLACTFPCYGSQENAAVYQLNGGGINAKFVSSCSMEKFLCENINLFDQAFYHRIGVELMKERILSDRFNRWTTLTTERATELLTYYKEEYDKFLDNSTRAINITEDPICFECKSAVSSRSLLP